MGDDTLGKRGMIHDTLDKTEFRLPLQHGVSHLLGIARAEPDIDGRVFGLEAHQPRRQPGTGDGLAGRQRQRAALQVADLGEEEIGAGRPRQCRLRLRQEGRPSLRQFDAPPRAVEQRDTVALLQHADRGADGRGREIERVGRLGQVLAFGHGDEDAELFERHHLFDPIE